MVAKRQYFGTDGIRGRVGVAPIEPEFMLKLGWAVGSVFGSTSNSKVIIGKDTRISGYMLESALEAGLSAAGVDIELLGPMPTPAVAYLTRTLSADAGIVISASHNPYHDNGIKFFSSEGLKLPDEIELAIEAHLTKPMQTVSSSHLGKARRIIDAPGRYIEFCKSSVSTKINLRGLTIVVDCANGATYHVAPHVFRELGAEVLELGVDPDGFNINEGCGSTHPQLLQNTVRNAQADLGIALDGDGDRALLVDAKGELVDGDEILFIVARHLKQVGMLKGGIVGTTMSNLGLEQALRRQQIDFVRSKVGDRYVMEKLKALNWELGGESSGHLIYLHKQSTGDGIVSALQVLSAMQASGKSLHELKQGMHKMPQRMINVPLTHPELISDKNNVIEAAIKGAQSQLADKGRVVLRRSGTEPVIRVMVEGEDTQLVDVTAQHLADIIKDVQHPV